MQLVQEALAAVKLGAPQVYANLALFPLLTESDRAADYLLLEEALERKVARITEVSAEGRVPELAFENASAERILLVDGDELVGAKQNRILNLSILVGAGRSLTIPVSCVEQGRWGYRRRDFASAGRTLFSRARASKMAQVTESMRATRSRSADQSRIWADVAAKVASSGADSATLAMGDAYESRAAELDDYLRAFRPVPRQVGAVLAIDGRAVGVELFDSSGAFAQYLPKLVRSYALDALETLDGEPLPPAEHEARSFLERLRGAAAERMPALGEGEDVRLSGHGIAGGALVADGRVMHLAGFRVA